MSNATAVSILAKLSGWYPFDGDLTDVHGSNTLSESVSAAGYNAGIKGQQVQSGSYAVHTLASPVAITPTTGSLTIGGWFNVGAIATTQPLFGFDFGPYTGTEAFKIVADQPSGQMYLHTWMSSVVASSVIDPLVGATSHPLTVRVLDSDGQAATSAQVIRIATGGVIAPGRYFVVGTWINGFRTLYIDGRAVQTATAPATLNKSSIQWITLGRVYSTPAGTNADCDECFFSVNAALTADEVAYLYNQGAAMSHADVVAAAA